MATAYLIEYNSDNYVYHMTRWGFWKQHVCSVDDSIGNPSASAGMGKVGFFKGGQSDNFIRNGTHIVGERSIVTGTQSAGGPKTSGYVPEGWDTEMAIDIALKHMHKEYPLVHQVFMKRFTGLSGTQVENAEDLGLSKSIYKQRLEAAQVYVNAFMRGTHLRRAILKTVVEAG